MTGIETSNAGQSGDTHIDITIAGDVLGSPAEQAALFLAKSASLIALAALLLFLLPRASRAVATGLAEMPGRALKTGVVAVLGGLAGLALAAVSLVGLPLALVVALAVPALLACGYVWAAAAAANQLAATSPWPLGPWSRFGVTAAIIIAIALVGLLPIAGPAVELAVSVIGVGAALDQDPIRLNPSDR